MDMESLLFLIFGLVFGALVCIFIYKTLKHGGLKAAMFGADIGETIGEVSGSGSKIIKSVVRVHRLEDASQHKAVGLEFVAKTFASYQMLPVTLSASDAEHLVLLLKKAVSDAPGT